MPAASLSFSLLYIEEGSYPSQVLKMKQGACQPCTTMSNVARERILNRRV